MAPGRSHSEHLATAQAIDALGGLAIALLATYCIENWRNQLIPYFVKFPQREMRRIDIDLREISSVVPNWARRFDSKIALRGNLDGALRPDDGALCFPIY